MNRENVEEGRSGARTCLCDDSPDPPAVCFGSCGADDPEATSLTARDVGVGSYLFSVAALTSLGEGGGNSITLTINPPSRGRRAALRVV